MANKEMTYLFCLDDRQSYSDEVKQRFSDAARYRVFASSSRSEMVGLIKKYQLKKYFKVGIVTLTDKSDQKESVRAYAVEIMGISPEINIIALVQGDNPADLVSGAGFTIYSWVPANNNSVLRIHNSVKRMISEMNLETGRKRVRIALRITVLTFLLSAAALVFAWYRASGRI